MNQPLRVHAVPLNTHRRGGLPGGGGRRYTTNHKSASAGGCRWHAMVKAAGAKDSGKLCPPLRICLLARCLPPALAYCPSLGFLCSPPLPCSKFLPRPSQKTLYCNSSCLTSIPRVVFGACVNSRPPPREPEAGAAALHEARHLFYRSVVD